MVTSSPTTATATPQGPLDLVIFGGAGDLSVRKLLPALYMAHLHHNLPEATRILALGRQPWDRDTFTAFIDDKVRGFIDAEALDDAAWTAFKDRLSYVCLDATQPDDFAALGAALQNGSDRVYYLATAPTLFTGICAHLAGANLIDARSRVVLEKPLGHDLASARQINEEVGRYFSEAADLPHRPLPGQGDGAKPDGAALWQHHLRAAVAQPVHQERADHRGRDRWAWAAAPASTTAPARCATCCRTTCCSCCASWPWSRRSRSTPTPCATKSSRCCARCAP